jgi:hypothetical protein
MFSSTQQYLSEFYEVKVNIKKVTYIHQWRGLVDESTKLVKVDPDTLYVHRWQVQTDENKVCSSVLGIDERIWLIFVGTDECTPISYSESDKIVISYFFITRDHIYLYKYNSLQFNYVNSLDM